MKHTENWEHDIKGEFGWHFGENTGNVQGSPKCRKHFVRRKGLSIRRPHPMHRPAISDDARNVFVIRDIQSSVLLNRDETLWAVISIISI
jgi:hypothetical protein